MLAFFLACYFTGARFAAAVEELKRRGEPVRLSELAPKVPADQPNAADFYENAFAVSPSHGDISDAFGGIEHWGPQELAAAAHLVATHPDYYELLDEASRVDVSAFPVDWDRGFRVDQSHLIDMRNAAPALAIKAHVQALRGDFDGAGRTCDTLLHLAEHERQSPLPYGFFASIAHQKMATRELSRLLALGDPSPAVCRTLYAQLAKPDWQAAFIRMLKAERANGLAEFAQVDHGFLFHRASKEDIKVPWQVKAYPFAARPWYNADKVWFLQAAARQIEACRKPWVQANRELHGIDREQMRASENSSVSIAIALLPIVSRTHWSAARTAAQDGAARIALALTVYRHDHGAYPTSLAELTQAGWKLPLDPFTQKPYHYRREAKGFTVWSIGPDLIDNHATDYNVLTFKDNQAGYDFVFRRPR